MLWWGEAPERLEGNQRLWRLMQGYDATRAANPPSRWDVTRAIPNGSARYKLRSRSRLHPFHGFGTQSGRSGASPHQKPIDQRATTWNIGDPGSAGASALIDSSWQTPSTLRSRLGKSGASPYH